MKIDRNPFRDYTAESALFVRRALVAFIGILLLSGVLAFNLYNLQIVRFQDYQTRSNDNRIKLVPIAPSRGIIYDRNGTPLAVVQRDAENDVAWRDRWSPLFDDYMQQHYAEAIRFAAEQKLIRKPFTTEEFFDPQYVTRALEKQQLANYWSGRSAQVAAR